MREKLIELIIQGKSLGNCLKDECTDCFSEHCSECEISDIADHLLANGVIVLPCGKGTKLKYDGIDYEVDHWNILASAFNDEAREKGRSAIHLFDVEEAYKALKGVE